MATRRIRNDYSAVSIDPQKIAAVTRSLTNPRKTKRDYNGNQHCKFVCPLCDYSTEFVDRWSWREDAQNRYRRHVREKHRNYYALAQAKPFIINEEEEFVHA